MRRASIFALAIAFSWLLGGHLSLGSESRTTKNTLNLPKRLRV